MGRRVSFSAFFLVALFFLAAPAAFAQTGPDVFVSTGPTGEILLGPGGMGFTALFTAGGGFKPEEIALAGDGRLYICDASNSEIFRFDPASPAAGLVTVYDRDSAVSPNDPEQPKGCTIAGDDLLFVSRSGRGRGAKTGLWAIRNITTAPSQPTLLLGLDSVGGISGQGLAVNFDGRVFFTFGNEVWVATPAPNAGRIDASATFERWAFTAGEGFGIATKGVPDINGSLQAQVFVAAKFAGVIEVLQEQVSIVADPVTGDPVTVRSGTKTGCLDIDVLDMPNSLEFDGSGDLWLTTSGQSNGRRGAVYEVESPVCGGGPFVVNTRGSDLSAALGIALTPTGTEPVTLVFPPDSDKSNTVNLCGSTFNLDQVTQLCQDTWTVSCRLMPKPEFELRTGFPVGSPAGGLGDIVEQDFQFTQCADFPGANGNCTEIRITQNTPVSQCTEDDILEILANWQFFSLTSLDHPGLLYSPGDFVPPGPEQNPFSENILVDYDPFPVPTDPLDPRATGSRDAWGSGLVVVEDAPNRPPTAVLTVTPQAAQCGVPVELDGIGSFDNDWNVDHPDSITNYTFSIDGIVQQSSGVSLYLHDTSGLSPGTHTASLQVADEGWDVNGPLTDSVDVSFEILADNVAPVISGFRLVDLGHPQADVAADGSGATMWPPNHEMVPFEVLYDVVDDCQSDCQLVITSSEPANGTGDGDIAPDIDVTGEKTFNLRSERAQSGNGRTYTVQLVCTDGSNTSTSDPITVFVPSNQ